MKKIFLGVFAMIALALAFSVAVSGPVWSADDCLTPGHGCTDNGDDDCHNGPCGNNS